MKSSRSRSSRIGLATLAATVGSFSAAELRGESQFTNKVNIETANDYSFVSNGSHVNDTVCNSEGDGFMNGIGAAGFTVAQRWTDNAVFDTDFMDPQKTADGTDKLYFDAPDTAISFVCLHGTCDWDVGTTCTKASDCAAGQVCVNTPPTTAKSHCAKNTARRLVTSSSGSTHGNNVFYGNGLVKWGESSYAGSWGGAGTNGGSNLIVLINSCGLRAPFWSQLIPAFAGTRIVAGIMPITLNDKGFADTQNWTGRGTYLANYARDHKFAPISQAWFAAMDSAPNQGNASCPDFTTNYSKGGGHGIAGCGAHFLMSVAPTVETAQFNDWEVTWASIQANEADMRGGAAAWIYWHCNYDCDTYPFTK